MIGAPTANWRPVDQNGWRNTGRSVHRLDFLEFVENRFFGGPPSVAALAKLFPGNLTVPGIGDRQVEGVAAVTVWSVTGMRLIQRGFDI